MLNIPTGALDWQDDANCRGRLDLDFFPAQGVNIPAVLRETCAKCRVKGKCRDWALEHEQFGFWGGLTYKERRDYRSRRHEARKPPAPRRILVEPLADLRGPTDAELRAMEADAA